MKFLIFFSLLRSTIAALEMCSANLMKDILKNANSVLLEPMMDLEISTPNEFINIFLNDIVSGRRGKIGEIKSETSKFQKELEERSIISAVIPLESTVGYTTFVRSISKGEASFVMKFKNYDSMNPGRQKEVLDEQN
jgi:elongation factor G